MKPAIIDLPTVCGYVGLSTATVQKMVRESEFPKPRLLSARRVGWLTREVDEWTEARPVADLLPPVNCGVGRGK
jgi:prophage regulatory protein